MKILPIDFKISGTKITIPFKAICSITDKSFSGNIIIEHHPKDKVLEYVSVEDFIKEISKSKTTAEGLTNEIFKEIKKVLDPKYLKVIMDVLKSEAHKPVCVWVED